MKSSVKIHLLMGFAILVIGATGTTDVRLEGRTIKIFRPCYSQEDAARLMRANGWSNGKATEVLRWSCEYAATPESK